MVNLGDDGRARMQQAVEPLLAKLRNDPATRDAMAEIESLRAGGSPHSLRCPAGTGTQQADPDRGVRNDASAKPRRAPT